MTSGAEINHSRSKHVTLPREADHPACPLTFPFGNSVDRRPSHVVKRLDQHACILD